MTKGLVLLVLALAVPAATAHSAIAPRDIDTRVAIDANSLTILDYGAANGLFEDAQGRDYRLPVIPFYEGGHDHMTLDMREAYGIEENTTVPGVYFRLTFRRGDPTGAGITDAIHFKADGKDAMVAFHTADNVVYTGTGLSWVSPRLEPGTYEFAVEGFASYSSLGVAPGAKITEIRTISTNDGKDTDVMPGTYYFQGNYIPDQTQAPAPENGPLEYQLVGPKVLLAAVADAQTLNLTGVESAVVPITITHMGTDIDQVATLSVMAPAGYEVGLSQTSLKLTANKPEGTVELVVKRTAAAAAGDIVVLVDTDLGGHAELLFTAIVPAAPAQEPVSDAGHHHAPGTPPHSHGEEHAQASPGVGPAILIALFALLARRK